MSQDYSSRYQHMKDNDPTEPQGTDQELQGFGTNDRYATHSHVRNICFVRANGLRCFLNYAYLVSVDEVASDSLLLTFTTHAVLLKGFRLVALFEDLMTQIVRIIACTADRYNVLADSGQPVVTELTITPHG